LPKGFASSGAGVEELCDLVVAPNLRKESTVGGIGSVRKALVPWIYSHSLLETARPLNCKSHFSQSSGPLRLTLLFPIEEDMVEDMLDFRRDKEKNRHYEFWNSRKLVESVRLLIVKYTDGKNLDACIEQM
jgi:hypothetical protein